MRAVLQRVTSASVLVAGEIVGAIEGVGILALIGVEIGDGDADADYVAAKIADLRLFDSADPDGPERSLTEVGGAALIVSQFTLLGDCRKGRRPSWSQAANPDDGRQGYEAVVARLRAQGLTVATGVFRADMKVHSVGDGPFTILLDSRKRF